MLVAVTSSWLCVSMILLVLMGFKGCVPAPATDQKYCPVSPRPPPDPDSNSIHPTPSAPLRFSPCQSHLLMRLWCLASFVPSVQSHSPAFSVDSVASGVQWCFIAWWPTFQSSFSQWLVYQVELWSYAIHMYWSLLFVWGGLVAACFAVSRLQRLAQTAVTCPTLHFGPLSVVCGYMLLWWLSQYHVMVEAVPHSTLWWFFILQVLPVYCIIFRGVSNAYQFWSEWILSSLMVPRRRAEPAPLFCGYTGS
jgi:hypothetical protein